MDVRTRFAPSPTGYLHIGGVRTALFNWLLARRHLGAFILRIDDTDTARHVPGAVELILEGFRWLGLDWDEGPDIGGPHGPYFQSQRRDKHEQALIALLESGWAYPCRTTPEELEAARQEAKAAKRSYVHRGPNRQLPPEECLALFRAQRPAVRFKVPLGETTVLEDLVRGTVQWRTDQLGDFTIARSGGAVLYNLASICDDLEMRITHVVRAEEHLSNTHPQLLIARALGAEPPRFAHVPYVAAPGSKKKLSKRNPPPGVMVDLEEYERAGYLPEAIINALARLGWSLDDRTEIMNTQTIIENFSLERVGSSPAALDPDKLSWMQSHYMQQLSAADRVERMVPFLQQKGLIDDPPSEGQRAVLAKVDAACGDRLKVLGDVVRYGGFFFAEDLSYDKKSVKTLRKEGSLELLEKLRAALAELQPFSAPAIEEAIGRLRERTGVGGKINHVLRATVTGSSIGPGIYECVEILGKSTSLNRIDSTLAALREGRLTISDQ